MAETTNEALTKAYEAKVTQSGQGKRSLKAKNMQSFSSVARVRVQLTYEQGVIFGF